MYLGTDDEKLRLLDDNEIDGPLCKFEGLRPMAEAGRIDGRSSSTRRPDSADVAPWVAVVGPENHQPERWVALCGSEGAY